MGELVQAGQKVSRVYGPNLGCRPEMTRVVAPGTRALERLRRISTVNPLAVFRDVHKVLLHEDLLHRANEELKYEMRAVDDSRARARVQMNVDDFRSELLLDKVGFDTRKGRKPGVPGQKKRWAVMRYELARRFSDLPTRDAVIIRAVRKILEAIFEPSFSEASHGYRSERTAHSCLHDVRVENSDVDWIIRGDVNLASIKRTTLFDCVREKIQDDIFLGLMIRSMGAGYFGFEEMEASLLHVPQPVGFSGVLANIYFNEFDNQVTSMLNSASNDASPLLLEMRKSLTRGESPLPDWTRKSGPLSARYYRYSNQIMVLVNNASEAQAKNIMTKMSSISGALGMSPGPFSLHDAMSRVRGRDSMQSIFLGTEIYSEKSPTGERSHLRMIIPGQFLVSKLLVAGFCDATGEGEPRFRWYSFDKDQIVDLYSATYNRILDYYSFAENYTGMQQKLQYLFRTSCSKLLAAKHKLRSRAKVYKKWGRDFGEGSENSFDLRKPAERRHGNFQQAGFFRLPNRFFL